MAAFCHFGFVENFWNDPQREFGSYLSVCKIWLGKNMAGWKLHHIFKVSQILQKKSARSLDKFDNSGHVASAKYCIQRRIDQMLASSSYLLILLCWNLVRKPIRLSAGNRHSICSAPLIFRRSKTFETKQLLINILRLCYVLVGIVINCNCFGRYYLVEIIVICVRKLQGTQHNGRTTLDTYSAL